MQVANLNSNETITTIELRELVNAARGAADESVIRNDQFVERVQDELEGEIEGAKFLHLAPRTKTEMVAYTLTLEQAMLVAMRESKAVRRSVVKQLKTLQAGQQQPTISSPLDAQLALAKAAAEMLNMADSGKVTMLTSLAEANGINSSFLPQYVVDAPAGDTTGSSGATKSATALLADWGKPYTIRQFNKILNTLGFIEPVNRLNSKGEEVVFNSITERGLEYGKNITSPRNPREVQPHWYVDKFEQLLKLADFCEWR